MKTTVPQPAKNEFQVQQLLEQYEPGIFVTDRYFKLLHWNQAALRFCNSPNDLYKDRDITKILQPAAAQSLQLWKQLKDFLDNKLNDENIIINGPGNKMLQLSCYLEEIPDYDSGSVIIIKVRELTGQLSQEQEQKTIYRQFINASPSPAWISDSEGHMLFMNELARKIWRVENGYQGKHFTELFQVTIAEEFLAGNRKVIETGEPFRAVNQSLREDGTMGFYMVHKYLLPLPGYIGIIAGQATEITEEKNNQEAVIKGLTEHKRLEAKLLQQQAEEQKRINLAMISAQDHERNELSKELHENVNQLLSSASILLSSVQGDEEAGNKQVLDKCQDYIQMVISEIRKISKTLNTSSIGDIGLREPIEDIVNNMRNALDMVVVLNFDDSLEKQLLPEEKILVYRIIQEQTNNIIKHADASQVEIAVYRQETNLHFYVRDNGKGFNPNTVKQGVGLINIRNRAEALHGSMNIESAERKGCLLEITVPLNRLILQERSGNKA